MITWYVTGSDNKIFIWNVGMGEVLSEIDFPDIPLSCSWNWDGSRVAVACKDHKVRIVEPRSGKFIRVSHLLSTQVSRQSINTEHCTYRAMQHVRRTSYLTLLIRKRLQKATL